MKILQRAFLARRRWDRRLVWLGGAALPVRQGITGAVAFFFALVGLYLVVARPRSRRFVARGFLVFSIGYMLLSFGLALFRGETVIDNRQLVYSLMIGVLAFIANGMVLVRDPLRYFVIGARVGTVLVAGIALWFGLADPARFGMDGNPAPFAMVAAIGLIAAIIPIQNPPSWAPNSPVYLLVGGISVFTSDTRSVLVVIPIILVVECVIWLRRRSVGVRLAGYIAGAAVLGLVASVGPVHQMIVERFVPIVHYYAGDATAWQDSQTAELRLSMWSASARAFTESPIIGHGQDRMQRVVDLAPTLTNELQQFVHVHNIVLDELLQHGILGLLLLTGALAFGAGYVIRHADSAALRRNVGYVLFVLIAYGMFHNPMLHESTIAALFFYLGATIAHATRCRVAARRRSGGFVPAVRAA